MNDKSSLPEALTVAETVSPSATPSSVREFAESVLSDGGYSWSDVKCVARLNTYPGDKPTWIIALEGSDIRPGCHFKNTSSWASAKTSFGDEESSKERVTVHVMGAVRVA